MKKYFSNSTIHKKQNTKQLYSAFFKYFFLHMSVKSSNFAPDFET